MAESEMKFLTFQEAANLVAAIREEENVHAQDRRILTVYDHDERELCWFDFGEVLQEIGPGDKQEQQAAVQNYILHHIPDWVLDI
ncbi:MAG: hypothetical protein KJ900_13205 [Proteobacteria bacterium]|jgi:hypothetical protein|nr:hypothetical protein [Desulfocapsa sp.]MBU3944294.1 hypothetical protein [Pseudomonadota bacterium]MBU4030209.1 hypothetical protein [Pseudomonadota bacterium]MBU4043836.1 hypothetical protein [Pseudomonadota bacterium]MBU4084783.1 hypothetical protein [Pseudomonadota bacterium]